MRRPQKFEALYVDIGNNSVDLTLKKKLILANLSKKPTFFHIFYLTPYRRNQIQPGRD